MTDRTNPDKRRALDAVTPPDQWDDIVARAGEAELIDLAEATGRNRGRWVLGAAAAVLVLLVAAIGVVALRNDGGDDNGRVTSEGGISPWGERWRLESITENGVERSALTLGRGGPVLDLTDEGTVALTACNRGSGEARIDDRLVLTDGLMMTAASCLGDDETSEQSFMEQESFLQDLLGDRPSVERTGDRLVLTADDGRAARFARIDERDPSTMFGRRWTAVAVTVDGQPRDLHAAGGVVLQFGGPSDTEATFPGMDCVPPYEGPIDGDVWSPRATVDLDCFLTDMEERKVWLSRLFFGPEEGDHRSVTVDVDGDRLTLVNEAARFEFVATQNPEGLVGKTWTVAGIEEDGLAKGVLARDPEEGLTFRVAAAGGGTRPGLEVTMGGGCNGKSAGVTIDGDRFLVGETFGSTYALCDGPGPRGKALMDQDDWLTAFLADDPLVAFQGDRLTLWTADRRVELAGDGSIGAPIDGRGGSPVEGPDGSTTETTTGPDGSVGGPIDPLSSAPYGPEDGFWGKRWLVTGLNVGGVIQPLVGAGDGDPYVVVETQGGAGVPVRIDGCEITDLGTATWEDGVLVAGGPEAASPQECLAETRRQEDRIIEALTSRPRAVGFVDGTGPGWVLDAGSVTIELREAGSFSFGYDSCGPTDGREVAVRLGRDVAGVGMVRIALVQGDGADEEVLVDVRRDPADVGYDDVLALAGFVDDPALGEVSLRISPVDALDELLVDRPVVDLGITCG